MEKAILKEIIQWSYDRPLWQQDALRRLIAGDDISEHTIDEFVLMCKNAVGWEFTDKQIPEPVPCAADDAILDDSASLPSIFLLEIKDVKKVNALAPDQVLDFKKNGLNIIYGDNGVGKSGYARILKRACRARSRGKPILPNIYKETHVGPATANIKYSKKDTAPEIEWQDRESVQEELMNISFFDSDCAVIHATEANDIAFTPLGLDLLPKIAAVCRKVAENLRIEKGKLDRLEYIKLNQLRISSETEVYKAIESISDRSNYDLFKKIAQLSDHETKKIRELKSALSDDPLKKSKEIQLRKGRIQNLKNVITESIDSFSQEKINEIKTAAVDADKKEKAAKYATSSLFKNEPLANVGGETWRLLWEAARKYSLNDAYPGQSFPFVGKDARCLLCHQKLEDDAPDRLVRFEKYIQNDTQEQATKARNKCAQLLSQLGILNIKTIQNRDSLDELFLMDNELHRSIRKFLVKCQLLRRSIYRACKTGEWSDVGTVPQSHEDNVNKIIENLEQKYEVLKKAAKSEERIKLKKELQELEARQVLSTILDDIDKEIERLKKVRMLETAIRNTNTTAITNMSGDLTNLHVFNTVKDQFEEELKTLGMNTVKVALESDKGQYGTKRYKIIFNNVFGDIKVKHVLSEGEHRCIALAGFLSELATSPNKSSLIFDDPVSSLDHRWRRKVALRLVKEAMQRQVIIFTHDIVFLMMLTDTANKIEVDCHVKNLSRSLNQTGICNEGPPWMGMSVKERIGAIKMKLQDADKVFRKDSYDAYTPLAKDIYGLLRETWERAVEEILLNKVVERFRKGIETKRIKKIAGDITVEDYRKIESEMEKCSTYLRGHDDAAEINEPMPEPDDVRTDILELETWVENMRPRRN